MNEEKKLVPKRRFPEFRGTDGWRPNRLVSICELITKGSTPTSYGFEYVESGVRFVKIESIVNGSVDLRKTAFITNECNEAFLRSQLKNGDILFSIAGALGVVARTDVRVLPANINQALALLRLNPGTVQQFIFQKLQTPSISHEIQRIRAGAAQPNLSLSQLGEFLIPLPCTDEQQKIADCLSSLDELIAALVRKVDALKTHKKGLMQQLFPREGETQPRLRFPEFQSAEDWEPKLIGQLGEVVTGSTPSTAQPEYYGGDRLFVSPADISDSRFIEKTKTTLTELGFRETRPIKANSILFVCIGSTIGKIAQNRHECATNQQINSVIPKLENSEGFVYYALSGLAEKIANLAGKQAVPIVNKSLFSSVELSVPKLPEQNLIADCLSSLDEKIFVQTQKLQALKTHKKALMQQLFPSAEAVEK